MKIKHFLFGGILALTTALGAFVGVRSFNKQAKQVEEVSAGTVSNPTIYFVPSDLWKKDSAGFRLKYGWNNVNGGSVDGTKLSSKYDGRDVYKFVVSNWGPNKFQLCRTNSTHSEEWNYSGEMDFSDGYSYGVNTVVMDANQNWWDTWTTNTSGVYWLNTSNYNVNSSSCSTPSLSTTRLFVYNSGTHWASGGKVVVRAWGGSADVSLFDSKTAASVYNLSWITDDNGTYYGYADIPLNVTGFQLSKFTTDNYMGAYQCASDYFSQNLTFTDFANCVIYCPSQGNTVTAGSSYGDGKTCGAELMTKVIEAIDVCSSNTYNGYGAYSKINSNFYSKATDAAKSEPVTNLHGGLASVQTHMDGMQIRSQSRSVSIIHFTTIFGTNAPSEIVMPIIIIATLVAVSAVGGYFLLRKRKEQ